MRQLLWILFSIFIFGCSNSSHKAPQQFASDNTPPAPVIYGADNRVDYFEVQNESLKILALSTVALVQKSDLVYDSVFNQYVFRNSGDSLNMCESEKYRKQPKIAFCSGSLIANDIILTAGHCIENQNDCRNAKFVFDYHLNSPDEQINSFKGDQVYSCAEIIYTIYKRGDSDFALIKLDRPVQDRPTLKLSETEVTHQDPLLLIGHPMGLPTKFAFDGKVRSLINTNYIVSTMDSFVGNSGSAVFNQNTKEIIGILVRGDQDWTRLNSCYIARVCKEQDCRGEDITRISEIKKYIPSRH